MISTIEHMRRDKKWYNVELPIDKTDDLKQYLKSHDIYFEPSSAGNLIHFECYMTNIERDLVNDYLERTNSYDPKARIE